MDQGLSMPFSRTGRFRKVDGLQAQPFARPKTVSLRRCALHPIPWPLSADRVVDATMKLLDLQAPGAKHMGLLATSATVESGIDQARAAGCAWMIPDAPAQRLANHSAEAILLACTERALVLETGDIRNRAGEVVPLIKSLRRAGPWGRRSRDRSDTRLAGPRSAGGARAVGQAAAPFGETA